MGIIVVVNLDSSVAGCRLRWLSISQQSDTSLGHQVKSIYLDDRDSQRKFVALFERAISKIPKLKTFYLKIRLKLRLRRIAKADLAVFGKPYGQQHMAAMKIAKRQNTAIVSDFCDFHSGLNNVFLEAAHYSDLITVPTINLANRIRAETYKHTIVIPDKLDYCVLPSSSALDALPDTLHPSTVLWHGLAFANNEPTYSFRIFCRVISCSEGIISNRGLNVEIVCESSDRAKEYLTGHLSADSSLDICSDCWSPDSMRRALSIPGFAILPYPEPVETCEKSANRIELALCSGKVVISNGSNLSSLENTLSTHVNPLPKDSLDISDLRFQGRRQYEQAIEARHLLDERCTQINHLWSAAISRTLK